MKKVLALVSVTAMLAALAVTARSLPLEERWKRQGCLSDIIIISRVEMIIAK